MSISVLMCTFNGEKYIKEQLESIFRQTQKPNEVLILDDHSSDLTVEIIRTFISKHSLNDSWAVEVNSENLGYAQNFKNGMKRVTGEIVFFCDQDDIWEDKKIEYMVDYFNRYDDACVIGTDLIHFYPNGKEIIEGSLDGTIEKTKYEYKKDFIPHPAGCTMAVKRSYILNKMELFSDTWSHDEFLWRVATVDGCCYRIHKCFMKHRMSGTNVTSIPFKNIHDRINQAERNSNNYNQLLVYSESLKIPERQIKIIRYFYIGNGYRFDYLVAPKFYKILKLFLYLKIYPTKKQFFGDLYYTLISNTKG